MHPAASASSQPATSARPVPRDALATGLFVLALLVGLTRFVRLGQWSLWFDEAVTWTDVHVGLEGGEISNPLGYRLIAWTVELLGGTPDELSLRLLPAVCGWLVIPLVHFGFRPFVGPRRSAAAALVVAASSWQLYWSQNARFYTMAELVSLAGSVLVLRGLWSASIARSLAGFALAGLGALFHPSAALVVPALALAPWILKPLRLPEMQRAQRPTVALLVLAVLAALVGYAWVASAFETFLRQRAAFYPVHYALTSGFYVTPLLATAALLGLGLSWRRRSPFGLFAGVVVLFVALAALVLSTKVRVSAQYVFVLFPWIAVLAMLPLEAPPAGQPDRRRNPLALGWLAVLVLPQLANTALYLTVRQGERPQWRQAYEFVWNRREPNDLVLGMEATVGEFYLDPRARDLRNTSTVAWLDKWRAQEPLEWARHTRRAWFVYNPEQLLEWKSEDKAEFERFLREECRLVKCFPLYVESRDLSVWVYLRG